MKKNVLVAFLVLVVAVSAFLYFPRGRAVVEAASAAVLAVLNGDVDAARGGGGFEPALDGEVFATGDVVRANDRGRAVLTFFEGSTLSVDPSASVRVLSLAKTAGGGIQLELEQSVGRTWASVARLASADSRFVMRTPSMSATVRGTAFETIVTRRDDGTVVTTIKTNEGEVVVRGASGVEVTVGAGQQVDVRQDQPPPDPQPQPPTAKLRLSAPAGVVMIVIDPRGLQCGSSGAGPLRQIPRCEIQSGAGQSVVIGEIVPGAYTVVLTVAQPVPDAAVVAEGLGLRGTDFSAKLARAIAAGEIVRSALTVSVGADGKLASPGFGPPDVVTSVCGAEASGRVFSSGGLTERADALNAYAAASKGRPAAIVYTEAELTQAALDGLKDAQASIPVTVSNVKVTADGAGLHLSASVAAGPLTVTVKGNVNAGVQEGKLVMRLTVVDAGPVPSAATEQIAAAVNKGLADFASSLAFVAQRVAFRSACFALIGKTPG